MQREQQIRNSAIQNDTNLNLPPSIHLSKDGEEGYEDSQRLLQRSCDPQNEIELVRAPPNVCIGNSESPPPYRSHSLGLLDRPGGKRDCNGSPGVPRCYSLSSNNNHLQNSNNISSANGSANVYPHHHMTHQVAIPVRGQGYGYGSGTRTELPPSYSGHSRSGSSSSGSGQGMGPPPEYSDVIANYNIYDGHLGSNV